MKNMKIGLAAVAAMAMVGFTAGTASATTLEVGGVAQNSSVSITASVQSGTKVVLKDTEGGRAHE
jgi:hypothetical protein